MNFTCRKILTYFLLAQKFFEICRLLSFGAKECSKENIAATAIFAPSVLIKQDCLRVLHVTIILTKSQNRGVAALP